MSEMSERPNFIFITTDQQRFDTIRAHGAQHMRTPHLDDMARRGISFMAAESTCPMCVPARTSILSGRSALSDGQTWMDMASPLTVEPDRTLPALLGQAGYHTQAIGKMHFWPLRARYGFDHMRLPHDYMRARRRWQAGPESLRHGLGQNEIYPALASVDQNETITAWTVDETIDFLETRDETAPFFCWTSFTKPHPPFDPPEPYYSMYRDVAIPEPVQGDWVAEHPLKTGHIYDERTHPRDAYTADLIAASRRAYYGLISEIDFQLGRLFARINELGLRKNTWVIFTSDHGELLGDHGAFGKGVGNSQSCRVPCIIEPAWFTPDHWRGLSCHTPVMLEDVMPTILNLAGLPVPDAVEGQDLLAIADQKFPERMVDGCWGRGDLADQHWITDGRYRYIYTTHGGHEHFFDEAEDPLDTRNLAEVSIQQSNIARLRDELHRRRLAARHPVANETGLNQQASHGPLRGEERSDNLGLHTWQFNKDVLH
jgi:arylsulfatase A-like enzyme